MKDIKLHFDSADKRQNGRQNYKASLNKSAERSSVKSVNFCQNKSPKGDNAAFLVWSLLEHQ